MGQPAINYRRLWWVLPLLILLLALYNVLRSFEIKRLWGVQAKQHHISTTFDIPGLGNLMFQYAALIGIALKSDRIPVIPETMRLNEIFDLPVLKVNMSRPGLNWGKVVEHKHSAYDSKIDFLTFDHDIEVVGFLQSWKYFACCQQILREHLQFHREIKDDAYKIMQDVVSETKTVYHISNPLYVGMHVRRGDFLQENFQKLGYTVADLNYTIRAMKYLEMKHSKYTLVYIVASDDIEWCKQNVRSKNPVFYSENHGDSLDLAILTCCNHTIMTTGTFSWWASWLANGDVVYYKDFPRNNSKLSSAFSQTKLDYFMPQWTGL